MLECQFNQLKAIEWGYGDVHGSNFGMEFLKFNRVWYLKYLNGLGLEHSFCLKSNPLSFLFFYFEQKLNRSVMSKRDFLQNRPSA